MALIPGKQCKIILRPISFPNFRAQLFKIDTKDKTTNEYISAIQEKAKEIADASDFTYEEVLKNTGYDDIIEQYQTHAEDIVKVLDDSIPKYYEKYEAGIYQLCTSSYSGRIKESSGVVLRLYCFLTVSVFTFLQITV